MATIVYETGLYKLKNSLIEAHIGDAAQSYPLSINKLYIIKPDLSLQMVMTNAYDFFQFREGALYQDIYPRNINSVLQWSVTYGTKNSGTEAYVEAILQNQYALININVIILPGTKLTWTLKDSEKFVRQNWTVKTSKEVKIHLFNNGGTGSISGRYHTFRRKVVVDNCDANNWINNGITATPDTVTVKEGTGSLKFTAPINSNGAGAYRTLTAQSWNNSRFLSLWVRPDSGTDLENAFKFYFKDTIGGTQLFPTYDLTQYYKLNGAKTAHAKTPEWRRIIVDISALTRGNVYEIGIISATNTAFTFYIDDIWRLDDITEAAGTSKLFYVGMRPDTLTDMDMSYYPFGALSFEILLDAWYATAIISMQKKAIYVGSDTDGILTNRHHGEDKTEDGLIMTWESYFAAGRGTTQTNAYNEIISSHNVVNALNQIATSNLRYINDECGGFQFNPKDRYETRAWLTDFNKTKGGKTNGNTFIFPAAAMTGALFYRDIDKWWEEQNVIRDAKEDLLQLVINKWKLSYTGLPYRRVWGEVTNSVNEDDSYTLYNTEHIATMRDGTKAVYRVWVYTASSGHYISKNYKEGDFQASYYNPVIINGTSYNLSYTYPYSIGSFWSVYTTAVSWGDSMPTLFDLARQHIDYLVQYYDLDGIIFSEGTIYYNYTFSSRDLALYNNWRTANSLPTLTDFDRVNNGQPVSPGNPYIADDTNLWNWRTWQVKQAMNNLKTLCNSYNKKLIVACNPDNSSDVVDKTATPWVGKSFSGNTPKYNGYYGARFGTGMNEIIKVCDLICSWNYFNFADAAYGVQSVYDFCDFMDKYQGRLYAGIGIFPDETHPIKAEDVGLALDYARIKGFKQIVIGRTSLDSPYWERIEDVMNKAILLDSEISNNRLVISCYGCQKRQTS